MSKKIACSCKKQYHYSQKERTKCLRQNGILLPSKMKSQGRRSHHSICECIECLDQRQKMLVIYYSQPTARFRLQSSSESSSDGLEISISPQQEAQVQKRMLVWDIEKIKIFMEKGARNPNTVFLQALKSRRLKIRRNHTFLRMYLFLNPYTAVIVQDWRQIVKPSQLMIESAQPLNLSSYRQRTQHRLDTLAKKYKNICTNLNNPPLRTQEMMHLQEKMDHLTEILRKFDFISEYSQKQIQQQIGWYKSIKILKKGQKDPHQINSMKQLVAISTVFEPPVRKCHVNRISQLSNLERLYERVSFDVRKYYTIPKRRRLSIQYGKNLTAATACMDIEKAEIMDIEQTSIASNEVIENHSSFALNHTTTFGRSYLFPRIVIKGRSNPMTMEEISREITKLIRQNWLEEEKSGKMISEDTKSKDFSSIMVFSAEKSLTQSDFFPQEVGFEQSKPFFRQFQPQSNLKLYSLTDINHFPRAKSTKKAFQSMDYQRCSRIGCEKWLSGSVYDCTTCNATYHEECWPETNFCRICHQISTNLLFSFNFTPEGCSQFKLMDKILTFPPYPLFLEETMTTIKQIELHFPTQSYCVTNCFQEDFIIYPFYNSQLRRLHHEDQKIIDQYDKQQLAFPVIVKEINTAKGRGLVARRPIAKGELVATYSGNVVSLAQASKYREVIIKDYLFHLISGPDVQTNFVIYPRTFASAGFFMNHADSKRNKSKINVKTFIALHRNRPIILMQASKKINYGEEFLYDYNGEYDAFNTHGFQ